MTPGLNRGDAISNDAYGMVETLEQAGFETVLFTFSGESDSPWPTYVYADARWKLDRADDLLIYHYCTVDENALSILRQLKCRMAVKYHNVTPSRFMAPWSDELAFMTRLGRMLLNRLVDLPLDLVIGDSEYNLQEIRRLVGDQPNMSVLPVFNHVEELLTRPGDGATVGYVRQWPTNILSVGRLAPNKGHEDMLEAFGAYLGTCRRRPHLHLVGSHDSRLHAYVAHLKAIIARHDMADAVSFHPIVGQSALGSFYRHCDLFWTGSQHEGFCVPAVEAMAFGLPILSTTAGALAETCGEAAVYADNQDEMADALNLLLDDDERLVELRRRGRQRYETRFHRRHVADRFLEVIDNWINPRNEISSPEAADAGHWFGLPHAVEAVGRAIANHPGLGQGLHARDRRLDLVLWILSKGRQEDNALAAYVGSAELIRFARGLEMPPAAAHFSPAQRLVWTFSRQAQELFSLQNRESVASFSRWYESGRRADRWS